MTGSQVFKLNEAAKEAVAAAGTGELSGLKLIKKLNDLGVDLVLMEPDISIARYFSPQRPDPSAGVPLLAETNGSAERC